MNVSILTIPSALIFALIYSCVNQPEIDQGRLIASVGSKNLYENDIARHLLDGSSATDSLILANGYIEQWIKKMAVLELAEKSLDNSKEVESLIEDYKNSLILNMYREKYAELHLDTTITQQQIEEYYEIVGKNFVTSAPMYQIIFTKIPSNSKGLNKHLKDWRNYNKQNIIEYCNTYGDICKIDDQWYEEEQLLHLLPDNIFKNTKIRKDRFIQKYNKGFEYFIKIVDFKDQNDALPLPYIKNKIKELVLQKRKTDLLKSSENNLYQQALVQNKIKVYID